MRSISCFSCIDLASNIVGFVFLSFQVSSVLSTARWKRLPACLPVFVRVSGCVFVCVHLQGVYACCKVNMFVWVSLCVCVCLYSGWRAFVPWDTQLWCRGLHPLRCCTFCCWAAACAPLPATHSKRPWIWMWLHASLCWAVVSTDEHTQTHTSGATQSCQVVKMANLFVFPLCWTPWVDFTCIHEVTSFSIQRISRVFFFFFVHSLFYFLLLPLSPSNFSFDRPPPTHSSLSYLPASGNSYTCHFWQPCFFFLIYKLWQSFIYLVWVMACSLRCHGDRGRWGECLL